MCARACRLDVPDPSSSPGGSTGERGHARREVVRFGGEDDVTSDVIERKGTWLAAVARVEEGNLVAGDGAAANQNRFQFKL